MYKYFTRSKSYRYVDRLQDLVHSCSHTYHRSIWMAPASVNVKNERLVRKRSFHQHQKKPKWRLDIGQRVRISKRMYAFKKDYFPGLSDESYIISKKYPTTPVTYTIKYLTDEDVHERFYEPELQLIIKEDNMYDVEKVITTRRWADKIEYYVKWKGKFNSSLILGWTHAALCRRTLKILRGEIPERRDVIYFCQVFLNNVLPDVDAPVVRCYRNVVDVVAIAVVVRVLELVFTSLTALSISLIARANDD